MSNVAITLIALVITIIVLLILAGVVLNLVIGENGIFGKANWTKFETNFYNIDEATHIYAFEKEIDKYGKASELADDGETQITVNEETRKMLFPITEEKKALAGIPDTLKETIKEKEGITDVTDNNTILYVIDSDKINIKSNEEYVVNIVSGKVYKYEGFKYKGEYYHRPDVGGKMAAGSIKVTSQVTGGYQFYKLAGSKVTITLNIELPQDLQGQTPTITKPTNMNGVYTNENYSNGVYTVDVETDGTNNPNGTYAFTITADGAQSKTESVLVGQFLEDLIIEVTDITFSSFKINVTNNYPSEAGIKYKYYVTKKSDESSKYSSNSLEQDTIKDITGLSAITEYKVKVEVYFNGVKIDQKEQEITTLRGVTLYVATTGNDNTGDGSINNPYATVKKAIQSANSGDAISIKAGTYNLEAIDIGQYIKSGIADMDKNLEIYGENEKTILYFDGTNVNVQTPSAINLYNSESIVRNLTYIFTPRR